MWLPPHILSCCLFVLFPVMSQVPVSNGTAALGKMRMSFTARCTLVLVFLLLDLALAKKKKDYYQMLGVKRSADDATLKKAYRKVAYALLHVHGQFPTGGAENFVPGTRAVENIE